MADPKKTDAAKPGEPAKDGGAKPAKKDGTRETVESIVIAFVFAFLFRTFEAEAFVIPTGSMAPTLLGRHKDAACPECGFEFPVGASEELDREGQFLVNRLLTTVCPNCRYRMDLRDDPVFTGDRILVSKFSYEVGDPDRWNVTVFKYPEDPTTNYIKRLVGLPGETLEIRQGDVYRIDDRGTAAILRKGEADKQLAVLQTVYDDGHPSATLGEAGWPERWAGVERRGGDGAVAGWAEAENGWTADREARTYRVAADTPRWLRYRHFVPTRADRADLEAGRPVADPQPRLVLDFAAYNAHTLRFEQRLAGIDEGSYWVGDLGVAATVAIDEVRRGGRLLLELVEGGRRYRCTIDPTAATATLSYVDGLDREQREEAGKTLAEAPIDLSGPGEYELTFANADDRLWLWVDGEAVEFPEATYLPFAAAPRQSPTDDDLTPVGIAAENLTATVGDLVVLRDVYYRGEMVDPRDPSERNYVNEVGGEANQERLASLADRPEQYAQAYLDGAERPNAPPIQFKLGVDEYFMLGDNSARSLDSRLWSNNRLEGRRTHRHAVPRTALVGKALFIFWPHGLRWGNEKNGVAHGWTVPRLERFFYHRTPDGRVVADYPAHGLPFYPDTGRIFRRIR